jgi:hypothetical protein
MLAPFTGHLLASAAPLPLRISRAVERGVIRRLRFQPFDRADRSKSAAGGIAVTSI